MGIVKPCICAEFCIIKRNKKLMDRFITSYENITLWQIARASLPEIARFVVSENYKHHKGGKTDIRSFSKDCSSVLTEEDAFFEYSSTIVAKDKIGGVVGAIRITNWNDNPHMLPLIKIFGDEIVNPKELLDSYHHLWHVGRFAIKQEYGNNGKLFKLLMLYAISPIFQHRQGVLLAEADEKLLRVMKALRIDARSLSKGKEYIGSMTIPMMVTKEGLTEFLLRNVFMAFDVRFDVEKAQLPERVKILEEPQNYPFGYCGEAYMYGTLQV